MDLRRILILVISALCFTFLPAQIRQKGKASYYSKRATGARTSSGERLHHDSMTCAHRTYPFGTKLKVTNPSTGKIVFVRVTDRGPYGRGRIIDLSWGAAKALGMLSQGVVTVVVEQADETIVPFRPSDDKAAIEFDYGSSDAANGLHPSWKEIKKANHKTPTGHPKNSSRPQKPNPAMRR